MIKTNLLTEIAVDFARRTLRERIDVFEVGGCQYFSDRASQNEVG
jgi:hypothetical protein